MLQHIDQQAVSESPTEPMTWMPIEQGKTIRYEDLMRDLLPVVNDLFD
jgi:hypothetical protein